MAVVSGFRALRFDTAAAGPLDDLVAPPYDVIGPEHRAALMQRSPNNIVHLTLPESPEQAGETLAGWRRDGVLVEEQPALWWVAQDYVGPDGVARTREGIAGSIEVTPYEAGAVLPHERTHAEVKAERLALLRATRTQLEPIFLLYDAEPPAQRPEGEPEMEVNADGVRTRLWRLPEGEVLIDVPLLIADGHHRYETAVAFRQEEPAASHTFAVLVSARSPGLEIFPTHRVAVDARVQPFGLMTSTWDTDSLALYQRGNFYRIESDDELDAREVERYELEDVAYTANAREAIEAVDSGMADVAFLLRPPTVDQVFAFAARGETMPQKSTYFYPKLTSGLLLHPL